MDDAEATYNLTALADRLFAEKRLLPLVDSIRRARDLHSLSADLVMALENLDALDGLLAMTAADNDFGRMITESALLTNAVILYARATKTASKERRGFDLTSRFTEEEWASHKELCDLRDHALAHFGSGGSYMGLWQAELVILQNRGAEAKPAVITRRKAIDKSLLLRTRKQVELAFALFRSLSLERLNDVTDEINKAAASDPEFHNEIIRHPLNLEVFFASPEAAKSARLAFDQEYAKGIVRHSAP